MRNGELLTAKIGLVRKALTKTNCNFEQAAGILGMTGRGVALFARRQNLVRRGTKPGQKEWVLA